MTSSLASAPTARPGWSRPGFWGLAVVGASMLALFEWLQMRSMVPPEIRTAYRIWQWLSWLLWVPVLAVASPLVRRMISARARPVVVLLTLLGGFLGTLVYWSAARAALSRFTGPPSVRKMPASRVFLAHFRGIIMPGVNYLAIVGILGTIELRRRLRREAPWRGASGGGFARPAAELDRMRVQLQPQLLEDTLRTTADFVRSGASTQAVQLLARLSDVLRLTLATLGQERVALRQEMEFVEAYLGLQQIRTRGWSRSRVDIAPEALTAEVPRSPCSSSPSSRRHRGRERCELSRVGRRRPCCGSVSTSWLPRSRGPRSPRPRTGWFTSASGSSSCTTVTTSYKSGTRTRACSARWTSRWFTSSRPLFRGRSRAPGGGALNSGNGGLLGRDRRFPASLRGHHTSQRFCRTIGVPAEHPKAAWNWGMFEKGPLNSGSAPASAGSTVTRRGAPPDGCCAPGLPGSEEELLLRSEAGVDAPRGRGAPSRPASRRARFQPQADARSRSSARRPFIFLSQPRRPASARNS